MVTFLEVAEERWAGACTENDAWQNVAMKEGRPKLYEMRPWEFLEDV